MLYNKVFGLEGLEGYFAFLFLKQMKSLWRKNNRI